MTDEVLQRDRTGVSRAIPSRSATRLDRGQCLRPGGREGFVRRRPRRRRSTARRAARSSRWRSRALKAVWHRGAVDADGKTGDGAGIRVDVPQDFFRDAVRGQGHTIANDDAGLRRPDLPAAHRPRRAGKGALDHRDRSRALRLLHLWLAPAADRHLASSARRPTPRGRRSSRSCSPTAWAATPPELERAALHLPPPHRDARARESQSRPLCLLVLGARADLQGHVPRRGHRRASISTSRTSASSRRWRSITSAIRPTPSRNGGWRSPSACSPTMARSTPSRATSTG